MKEVLETPANPDGRGSIASAAQNPDRAWGAPGWLRTWHLASLDAPTVAVVWSLAIAWAAGVRVPWWSPLLMALAVWAVYVGDRLLDASRGLDSRTFDAGAFNGLRERHFFHWRYRRALAPLGVAAAITALCIVVVEMPAAFWEKDSFVAAAALAYFKGVHSCRGATTKRLSRVLTKELLVGILFAAGCALPAWNRAAGHSFPILAVALFAALAWLNCYAIDRWEARNGDSNSECAALSAILIASAGALAAISISASEPRGAALLAAGTASAVLLAWLDRMRFRLTPLALRSAADLVLLTPLALLLR